MEQEALDKIKKLEIENRKLKKQLKLMQKELDRLKKFIGGAQ